MRNGRSLEVELDHILLGRLDGLPDSHGDFARLAHAKAGMATLISHDDESGEAEILTALNDLGAAGNGSHLVFQIGLVGFDGPPNGERVFEFLFRHRMLDIRARLTGRFSKSLHAAV